MNSFVLPPVAKVACGEATMCGDYHAREVTLCVQRFVSAEPYYVFVSGLADGACQ